MAARGVRSLLREAMEIAASRMPHLLATLMLNLLIVLTLLGVLGAIRLVQSILDGGY